MTISFDEKQFGMLCTEYEVDELGAATLRKALSDREFEDADEFHWEFCIADGDRLEADEQSATWALNTMLQAESDVIGKEFSNKKGDTFGIILPCQDIAGGIKVAVFNEQSATTHKSFPNKSGIAEFLVDEGLTVSTAGNYERISMTDKFIDATSRLSATNKSKLKM